MTIICLFFCLSVDGCAVFSGRFVFPPLHSTHISLPELRLKELLMQKNKKKSHFRPMRLYQDVQCSFFPGKQVCNILIKRCYYCNFKMLFIPFEQPVLTQVVRF